MKCPTCGRRPSDRKYQDERDALKAEVERLRSFEQGWDEIEDELCRTVAERASVDLVHYVPRLKAEMKTLKAENANYVDSAQRAEAELALRDSAIASEGTDEGVRQLAAADQVIVGLETSLEIERKRSKELEENHAENSADWGRSFGRLAIERDEAKADLAEAVALLRAFLKTEAAALEQLHDIDPDYTPSDRATVDVNAFRAFLAKHDKGGE